ncbi:MAG: amidohydrolase family protein [Pseudomonadales bacterium]|nr:amidohydrolase family protein [Pseudomonadales bacterium]
MAFDLVVKNGTVVDGTGAPGFRADIGVNDGKITAIGRLGDKAYRTVDADGHVVTPGFIDGHTHMDAQIFWDPLGSCSCYHGVTSVVMGNCGFTIAPCAERDAGFVFKNLERAEDISPGAMQAGIEWSWETFPEFLDTVDELPKGINYAGYIGHSAIRTYVMGERAFTERASTDELGRMCDIAEEGVRAGAIGFSTSRTPNHVTADDLPVASRVADWEEVRAIVSAVGRTGRGLFEIAGEQAGRDPDRLREYHVRLRDLAVDSGVVQTWGMFSSRFAPDHWRSYFGLLEETAAAGGRMFVQVHSRALNTMLSFKTQMPFDRWDLWSDIRALSLDDQKRQLRDPDLRKRLVAIANGEAPKNRIVGVEARPPDYDHLYVMDSMVGEQRLLKDVAGERGVNPVALMIDLSLETDFDQFFCQPAANENQDHVLEMMKHPRSVVTFSDSGAHVSQIMDSSLQTHLLSHWVREKEAMTLEEAVRELTCVPATYWGMHDRGLIREGLNADLVVFDPKTVAPRMPEVVNDLPSGATRLKQVANGIRHSIVNGEVFLTDNEHTGSTSGRLFRGRAS